MMKERIRTSELLRLNSEAEILHGLNCKGLPKFEPSAERDNMMFTLREYIEGVSLEEYINESPTVSEDDAVRIVMELCDIVSVMHSQPTPIIHRDIKPTNVIINPDDNAVTLIDFGIFYFKWNVIYIINNTAF
jgi:serine/threonine-protein kinase